MRKRLFDVVFSALLIVFAAPIVLVAAVGVALSLRAWPFFVQERVGQGGRTFRIIKLRTLPPSAPRYADKYALADVDVPWFPQLLRRTHLDELPQLALVLVGRMSLVGPRPEMEHLAALLDDDIRADRERFRPGCTGLWQVSRDADRLIVETPAYDRFYAAYTSFRLDLYILVRTVVIMVRPNRGLALQTVPAWVLGRARVDVVAATTSVAGPATFVLSLVDRTDTVGLASVDVAS